jgi:hypothetical protein
MPRSYRRSWQTFFLVGAWVGVAAAACAADEASPAAGPAKPANDPLSPPEVVKPVIPGKAELAESAFKKLDPTGKGYVTLEDTKGLAGFEQAFRVADTDHTGKLDLKQFKKAWADYSGYRDKQ